MSRFYYQLLFSELSIPSIHFIRFLIPTISGYGFAGFKGDDNDLWRVEITEHSSSDPVSKDHLRTLHSKFRLVHVITGCHLFSHKVKLPNWGFEQQEVTCIKGGSYPKTVWMVESNKNDQRKWRTYLC